MKIKLKCAEASWRTMSKIFLIMKLIIVILIIALTQVNAKSYGQITLHEKNVSVEKVLLLIENQSEYHFIYDDKLHTILKTKTLNINIENQTITHVLDKCLNGIPVSYKIIQKTIVLKEKEQLSNEKKRNTPPKKITGKITDKQGLPIPGVTVKEKGGKAIALTGTDGSYTINVSDDNAILTFSFIGFTTKEIRLNGNSELNVVLEDTPQDLSEVVVIGYGTQKKESVTGAISTIATKDLVQSPVANLGNALAGRLSGLTAIQTSGKPGDDNSALYIRGVGTYTGQTTPLIMVDGIVRDSYADIDANEVESISVLKDASATAVYGVRGANGVILITTKRGKEGAPKVSATAQTAISQFSGMPDFVNSYQYALLLNERSYENYWVQHSKDADIVTWNDFVQKRDANWIKEAAIYYSPEDLKYYQNAHTPTLSNGQTNPYYDPYGHPDQDWKKQIFKNFAPQTQYNANINGGTESVKYFVSLGYLNQGGLFNTDYLAFSDEMEFKKKRYNLRGNLDFDVNKNFRISGDISTQFVNITGMDNDGYSWEKRIMWSSPLGSPGIIDGKFVVPFSNPIDQNNPLYAIASSNSYNITNNSTLNSAIKLSHRLDFITRGLSVIAKGAYDSYFSSRSGGTYKPLLYGVRANPNGDKLDPVLVQLNDDTPPQRWSDWANGKWRKVYGEFSVNYNRKFGKHAVTGLLLYNAEKRFDPNYAYDLPHAYMGVAGRITYAYANRYLAEYNVGYNGSENFPEDKRFGFLPAYSLGWVASNESFFPKNDYVTYLKVRGSLGKVGNDNIGGARYLYLPDTWQYGQGYNNGGGYTFGILNERNTIQGAYESVIGNPNVTWETATKSNVGIETHLFKDRVTLIFDHYNEHRINILSYRGTVPSIVQATLPPYNLGEVKNWGNELELTYNSAPGKFTWRIRGNASTNKNKIIFRDEAIVPGLEYQAATDRPINQPLILQADGLYTSWADLYKIDQNGNPILASPVRAVNAAGQEYVNAAGQPVFQKDLGYAGAPLQPGEVKLVDVNGDGVVNEKDYTRTGKTNIPELSYGFSLGFSYKGFDFSTLFQGVGGVAKFANSSLHFNRQQSLFEVDLNRFTQERYDAGERIDFPIAAYNQASAYNTFFLKNASYTRLKNMEIGYTLKPAF